MKKISEAEFNKAQKLIEDYKKQKQSLKFEKEIEDFAINLRKAYDECSIRYENKPGVFVWRKPGRSLASRKTS